MLVSYLICALRLVFVIKICSSFLSEGFQHHFLVSCRIYNIVTVDVKLIEKFHIGR